MMRFSALLILPLLSVVTSIGPPSSATLSVTCTAEPSYTFTVTGGSAAGVIYINDEDCKKQDTVGGTGTYTFDSVTCADGTVPALGDKFTVIVQKNANVFTANDPVTNVICTANYSEVTEAVDLGSVDEVGDGAQEVAVKASPHFTISVVDEDGDAITASDIGEPVDIKFSLPDYEIEIFYYKIITMSVSSDDGANSYEAITTGCSNSDSLIFHPDISDKGKLTVNILELFIPTTTTTLPNSDPLTLTFTFALKVCDKLCTEDVCNGDARKRRSVTSSSNSTSDTVNLSASLVVWPAGSGHASITYGSRHVEEDACISITPLIGVLVALSVALVVCMALTSWMFFHFKRSKSKDSSRSKDRASVASFANHSYTA